MAANQIEFFIGQLSLFVQYFFRNQTFANIMNQSGFRDDIQRLLVDTEPASDHARYQSHVDGMCIDGIIQCAKVVQHIKQFNNGISLLIKRLDGFKQFLGIQWGTFVNGCGKSIFQYGDGMIIFHLKSHELRRLRNTLFGSFGFLDIGMLHCRPFRLDRLWLDRFFYYRLFACRKCLLNDFRNGLMWIVLYLCKIDTIEFHAVD